jgi:hypothetical protein
MLLNRPALSVPLCDEEFSRLDQALQALPQTDPRFEELRLETIAIGRAYLASINILRICRGQTPPRQRDSVRGERGSADK